MTDKEKDAWQKYIDNFISHAISSVEYGNYFYNRIKEYADSAKDGCQVVLNKYEKCVTKARRIKILKEIESILLELETDIAAFISLELPKIIKDENKWIKKNLTPLFDLKLDNIDKAVVKVGIIPVATAGAALKFGSLIHDRLRNIYNSEVTQGYVTGTSFEELADDYESRFSSFNNNLEADAETLGSSLGEQYERVIFTKNKDKIKRYMWSSVLDTSTCILCGSLDGQIYDDVTNVAIYPAHDRCRCRLVPLPDYVDEDVKVTYSDWFERQSDKDKYKILGKTRFHLYENGMKIKRFVNNGKITPLKELNVNQTD